MVFKEFRYCLRLNQAEHCACHPFLALIEDLIYIYMQVFPEPRLIDLSSFRSVDGKVRRYDLRFGKMFSDTIASK